MNPPTSTRRSPTLPCLAGVLLWAALAGMSHAAGEQAAFKGTNLARFNADDLALMKSRVAQVLAAPAEGETLTWKNDRSGASGEVTALARETWNGLACRHLRIVNIVGSSSRQGVYRFCEQPAGRWKLAGPVPQQPSTPR